MTKEKLAQIIQGLLKTEVDLSFLSQLNARQLEAIGLQERTLGVREL
jgi:hypothetical protein